jgi:small conductance mechanosensitive channel
MADSRRRRLSRELFETRSHAWRSLGLGDQLTTPGKVSKRALCGLLLALLVLAATLVVYFERQRLAPGYGGWIRIGTVLVLVIAGAAATHWLARGLAPRLNRRLDPATAGTAGFVVRLLAMAAVVILALRVAGVRPGTLAVGGAFTAVLLGLAAQQALGGIFAASSCRARGRSGSANGCGWSAACWPARWRAPSPRSGSSTRR